MKRFVIVLIVVLIAGGVATGGFYLGRRSVKQAHAEVGTTSTTVPKPSASDILACDDFNMDFAQLVDGNSFGDLLVLQAIDDGLKASDPGIRLAAQRREWTRHRQAPRRVTPTFTHHRRASNDRTPTVPMPTTIRRGASTLA